MTDNSNLSRRRFLQATGGAAAAVALAGCTDDGGNGNQTTTGSETTTSGTTTSETTTDDGGSGSNAANTFQRINSTMSTLDPIKATDTASGVVIQQIFDALMNYPNGEVEPVNLLAKDYQTSSDFTKYTFNLKKGAKYHNGKEVTAKDVVYSFERLAQSENSRRQYFILDSIGVKHQTETVTQDGEESEVYKPNSLAISAPDKYTFEMELSGPFHSTLPMLAYTSFSVIPEGIVGDIKGYEGRMSHKEFSTSNPIGAGPFQFEKWQPNTECRISRFEDYHGEKAKLSGVRWQIMSDPNAMYNYSMNKNSDLVSIPTSKYDPNKIKNTSTDDMGRTVGEYGPLRNGLTADYLAVATINSFYIGFNTNNVEKPARQAMAYAMNQKTMVEQAFKGRGATAYMFTPPSIFPGGANAYRKKAKEEYPYGYNQSMMDKARQVMEDAGYNQNNKYKFTFTMYKSGTAWHTMGQVLRDQLTACHIDMQLEKAPFATLLKRGRNGNLDAYSLGWIMDWPAPDNFLQLLNPPQTDTSKPAPTSYLNWSGTEASQRAKEAWKKIEQNQAPTDAAQKKRNEAYIAMEEANWEDVCFLNVYHQIDERFSYKWVDMPKFGGAGMSRMKMNTTTLSQRQ